MTNVQRAPNPALRQKFHRSKLSYHKVQRRSKNKVVPEMVKIHQQEAINYRMLLLVQIVMILVIKIKINRQVVQQVLLKLQQDKQKMMKKKILLGQFIMKSDRHIINEFYEVHTGLYSI